MAITQITLSQNLKNLPDSKNLGFGQFFSDHLFLSKYKEGKGWYDSRIEPYGPLQIDPAASVLHYGQALFEGMKAFVQQDGNIVVFRPEFNWHRLCEGSERLCLVPPPRELFMEGIRELIRVESRWIPKEDNCSLYIRPTLIGTEPFLGVRPSREMLFYVLLSPVGSYYASGADPVKIWVEDKSLRAAPGGLGATKAGANYAASLQSALNAKKKGYAQVLWLDTQHEGIEEVGTMNVFFVLKDEIVTPSLNGSILAGGIRDSVLQLLRHQGHKVSERRITISEVLEKNRKGELLEAFGTGTAAVISPIGELNYKNESIFINNNQIGDVGKNLLTTISGIQRGRVKDPFGWMVPLDEVK